MDVPVYLFTGLMDSGKTSLITQTLMENDFGYGAKGLIIACEDGEVEYDEEALEKIKMTVVGVEKEEDFTSEYLAACAREFQPDMVFIEYNGMWQAASIWELELPENWQIIQALTTMDASTYESYLKNMRAIVMEQVFNTDVVIFNRCKEDTPKGMFRRSVKAVNRKAQIVYEREDGTIDQNVEEELPFDINSDIIEISDDDYGIWYLDCQDDPKKYEGKKVRYLALVYRPDKFGQKPVMIPGRFAMTCCEEDITFIGFKCKYDGAASVPHKSWIWITSEVKVEFAKEYRGKGPVLYALKVEPAEEPEDSLVYFT